MICAHPTCVIGFNRCMARKDGIVAQNPTDFRRNCGYNTMRTGPLESIRIAVAGRPNCAFRNVRRRVIRIGA